MTPYTSANVSALKENPAWEHIVACLEAELRKAEAILEQEGEFNHGKGVGMKQIARMLLALPDAMADAAKGKPAVSNVRMVR